MTRSWQAWLASPARARMALAVVGAVLALNLMSLAFGEAPAATLRSAFEGTWGTAYGAGQVMFKATPLLLAGLGFHVALRAGLFNIGAEGQLALASLAAAWVGARVTGLPWPLGLLVTVAAALAVGAGYAGIAGVMRARLGVHEIISGIMLNRSAEVLLPWLLVSVLGAAELRTRAVAASVRLAPLERLWDGLRGSAASIAFPLALAVTFATYAWLARSRTGRELRWVGQGADACAAHGIDVARRRVQAMALSGALVSLGMAATVLGYKGYYELGLGAGAGFSGIAVAMVGGSSPTALCAAALLLGTLAQGGLAINALVPREATGVLEALVILLCAVASRSEPAGARAPASPGPAPSAAVREPEAA